MQALYGEVGRFELCRTSSLQGSVDFMSVKSAGGRFWMVLDLPAEDPLFSFMRACQNKAAAFKQLQQEKHA